MLWLRKSDRSYIWKNQGDQKQKSTLPHFSDTNETSKRADAIEFVDIVTRGVGQVIFLNSVLSGRILVVGLFVGNPYLCILAILGAVTATATAKAVGLDDGSTRDGLLGYNGCLVGCAAAVFRSNVIVATIATVLGAAATPFVAVTLKEAMGSIPQWSFASNIVIVTALLRTQPLLNLAPASITYVWGWRVFFGILTSPLTGISQIFVVRSFLSGALILLGIRSYSPMLARYTLAGSTIGTLVGAFGGAPLHELNMGLYGYNSALTSMAVGVFFVHSKPTMALSAGGAFATASLFGAMKAVFGAHGSPCGTLPFCITMSACYMMQKHVPGMILAINPHSPEKNK